MPSKMPVLSSPLRLVGCGETGEKRRLSMEKPFQVHVIKEKFVMELLSGFWIHEAKKREDISIKFKKEVFRKLKRLIQANSPVYLEYSMTSF
ncbi:hypothetical protein GQ43DRAFT_281402 [Delitschia confertaspora ATCC 74209]|uniref:Uncharacterized protein n=1 Tax=Delitschia confertaspora ATCC 74209 TaxID=1513339 RepID=A0A9P4JG30_9PLEO|nr:hypothetical protein GQ43DRAFT_281402 [Delitschia confertaspora ATCC 74209]